MKIKTIFILSIFVLLISAFKVTNTSPSWYNTTVQNKRVVVLYDRWVTFDTNAFSVLQDGLYTLSGDTFLTADTGLTRISGTCRQGKPGAWVQLVLVSPALTQELAQTGDPTFSFSAAYPSGNTQLQVHGNTDVFNELFCNVLFEKMK